MLEISTPHNIQDNFVLLLSVKHTTATMVRAIRESQANLTIKIAILETKIGLED